MLKRASMLHASTNKNTFSSNPRAVTAWIDAGTSCAGRLKDERSQDVGDDLPQFSTYASAAQRRNTACGMVDTIWVHLAVPHCTNGQSQPVSPLLSGSRNEGPWSDSGNVIVKRKDLLRTLLGLALASGA